MGWEETKKNPSLYCTGISRFLTKQKGNFLCLCNVFPYKSRILAYKIVFPLSSTIFDLNIDLYVLTYSCTLKNRHCWVGNVKIIFHLLLYFLLVSWGRIGRLINHPSPASLTSSVLASFRCLLQTTQTNFQVRVNPASCGFSSCVLSVMPYIFCQGLPARD